MPSPKSAALATSLERALAARFAPMVVAALTALFLAWLWGSLTQPAAIHDEAAYLLQARLYAAGQITAPAPPLPEFFEQYHVLVTPRLVPKYPPGHALALVPGIWLGLPGLMPLLLCGLAGGLLFALGRQIRGVWVGALAWAVWLTSPNDNLWRCTYLSESTSTALCLGASWFLLRWWRAGRSHDLVFVALLVGGLALTRPLTAVAFALPVAVRVAVGVWRRRAFASLGAALAAGVLVMSIVPVWNAASTLDWRVSPYAEHSRVYFPYQKLGFGVDPAPARRALPPDMALYDATYRRIHAAHTLADLPRTALARLYAVGREFAAPLWRAPLIVFLALGLLALPPPARFGLAASLALFAVYLLYAHPLDWLIYYYEAHAFLALAAALGLWRAGAHLTGERRALFAASLVALGHALGARDALDTRETIRRSLEYHQIFARALAKISDEKAIVFVRYAPDHDPNYALVENPPEYASAHVWVVYDRGQDNARLLALAPERVPYLFDEASNRLYRLDAPPPSS